jgi:hypothetical protein
MDPNFLKTVLPIIVIAGVLALRLRSMNRVRPLKPDRLWVLPAILVLLAGVTLWTNPPGLAGLSIAAVALIAGGLIGWQRGRLIRIERDPENGNLTQRASPAAMILLVAIIALRFALRSYFDATPGADGKLSDQALVVTDALLLFAVGLIAMTRIEIALRARRILVREPLGGG